MDGETFRIEIPVEVINKSDSTELKQLEDTLAKMLSLMKQNETAAGGTFKVIKDGASSASAAMEDTADAAKTIKNEAESLDKKLDDVSESYDEIGTSANEAGRDAGTAFTSAATNVDKFTQRVEKSNKSLRDMFREKLSLTLAAIDKASPVLREIWSSAKGLASKTWHVAVRMKDFITAPFRKIANLISSPITMALSIAGVGLSAGDMVQTFTNFESGMSAVQSLSGATGEDLEALTQTAKDLGATTSFSAAEASAGMQYLAMAGWETNQIIAAMPGLLDLAAAGATDLGTAADIVSDVMTAMGMEATEASRAADVFAKTATSTNTTITGLGATLKYAAPIAHSFGLELEDVAAVAGLMANAGIKGEMAGTSLRSSMLRMSSPTKEMTAAMNALGISFSDSEGKMKGMSEIVRTLETAFSGLSESERLSYAQDLFGTEAASAWLGVISQGGDAYDKLAESLYNSAGAAKEMAEVRLDNLAGDMTILGSAVEGAKIELMDKIAPYLRQGVQWLTAEIPVIQDKIGSMIDTAIQKASALKDFIAGVFSSSEMQNADGFAEKFFIAWDKIIVEPFTEWWDATGKDAILGAVSKIGQSAGELLRGIITGIFAALKGEEIDFDGLNLGGIAKAGAETAKEFAASFANSLDVGAIAGAMPNLLKAGIIGGGALKVGSGALQIVKWVTQLKGAFAGVTAAGAGVGQTVSIFGALKGALMAIPGYGWAAAAAITALGVGLKVYTDRQKENEEQLKHFSDAGADAAREYEQSANRLNEITDTIDSIKEVQVGLSDESLTDVTAQEYVNSLLNQIDGKKAEIQIILSEGSTLAADEVASIADELTDIQTRRTEIELMLSGASLNKSDIESYKTALESIQSKKYEIDMRLAQGADSLNAEDLSRLKAEYADLQTKEVSLTLMLDGAGMDAEQFEKLQSEYNALDEKQMTILAQMSEAGMKVEDIEHIVELIGEIGDAETLSKNIDISMSGDSVKDLENYNAQLSDMYAKLIELSGGEFTQYDVDNGLITQERLDAFKERAALQARTDLTNFRTEVETGRGSVADAVARRDEAAAMSAANGQYYEGLLDAKSFFADLDAQRQSVLSQYRAGMIDDDALEEAGNAILDSIRGQYGDQFINTTGMNAYDLFGTSSLFGGYKIGDTSYLADAMEYITGLQGNALTQKDEQSARYNEFNAPLIQQYANEKQLIERETFFGTDYATASLEEIAANYTALDEAGRQMFEDAVNALNALNAQADYVQESDKTQAAEVVEIAQKAEIMQQLQEKVQAIADEYGNMSDSEKAAYDASESGAASLEAINNALDALGAEKIGSLTQISEALAAIQAVDLNTISTATAQSAFRALSSEAREAETSVDSLKAALVALDGTTATTSVQTVMSSAGVVAQNANGGIYNGAFLSMVAEDGPEAIIPLGKKRRDRGVELWIEAGRALGVNEFADGGIVEPYADMFAAMPDYVWSDGDGESLPYSNGGNGGSMSVAVSVNVNPAYEIDGGNAGDIVEQIKNHQEELAEILGGRIADELQDIITNMA